MAETIAELKTRVSLAALVAQDLGQPVKQSGGWQFWRCPFHDGDHDPSFGVKGDGFFCFGCKKHGDALDWLKDRQALGTTEALSELRRLAGLPELQRPPETAKSNGGNHNDDPPPEPWQERARAWAAWAAEQLWTPAGAPGLAYLQAGGLTEATIRAWGLGWCPKWYKEPAARWGLDGDPVSLPRGVVIPCEVGGVFWYGKVRVFDADGQPATKPKYHGPRGGHGALFGADRFQGDGRPLLLCEGERDTLLAWQELRDLADVATLGGASAGLGRWALWLLAYRRIVIAFDNDENRTGQNAAAELQAAIRRAVVRIPPHGDLTDFHAAGGDLRAWLGAALDAPTPTLGAVDYAAMHQRLDAVAVGLADQDRRLAEIETGHGLGAPRPTPDPDTERKIAEARVWAEEAEAHGVPCNDAPSWAVWLAGVIRELQGMG